MRKVFCETLGSELLLPEKCNKIVSLSPSATEALFDMGLGEKVVGVSSFCLRPPEARTKEIIGSYSKYRKEKLKEINPDIIFTTTGYQRKLAKELSQLYNVYAIKLPTTLSEIVSTSVEVGIVAGYYENARQLEKKLLQKLAEYLITTEETTGERVENKETIKDRKFKVYIEIDLGGPTTFGAYSYITDTLHILGLENIYGNKNCEWLKPEDKLTCDLNPDIIIYERKMFLREKSEEVIKNLISRFQNTNAVRNNNIFITPEYYDFFAHHGPSFIYDVIPFLISIKNKIVRSSPP